MNLIKENWDRWIVVLCTAAILLGWLGIGVPVPHVQDYLYYQTFTETLAAGRIDLSIPGFHGGDFLGVIVYLLTKSPLSHVYFQMLCGAFIPLAGYLAGSALFKQRTHGVLLAVILTMMPYVIYPYITGYTQASNILLYLLTIYGVARNHWWTGVAWALAITTKPFSVIILPLMIALRPQTSGCWKRNRHLLIGLSLPALYVLAQVLQTGEVLVGVHGNTDSLILWDGLRKILGNAAWGVQSLFSIHNYYYANPALTGHWNLLHTTPLLITLGLFGLLAPKTYFPDRRLRQALSIAAIFGFTLNTVVSMDNYYMHFLNLILILAALPVLHAHRLWIPLVILTLHYQWFYFYLEFHEIVPFTPLLFAAPVMVDVLVIVWSIALIYLSPNLSPGRQAGW